MDAGDRYDLNDPERSFAAFILRKRSRRMNDEETVTALNAMWNNFCVTDAFEPGSVVKPIVMAGALEKGSISQRTTLLSATADRRLVANNDTFIKCAVYPDAHGTEASDAM